MIVIVPGLLHDLWWSSRSLVIFKFHCVPADPKRCCWTVAVLLISGDLADPSWSCRSLMILMISENCLAPYALHIERIVAYAICIAYCPSPICIAYWAVDSCHHFFILAAGLCPYNFLLKKPMQMIGFSARPGSPQVHPPRFIIGIHSASAPSSSCVGPHLMMHCFRNHYAFGTSDRWFY